MAALRWKRFPEPVPGNRLSNQRYKWDHTMRRHVLPRIGDVPVGGRGIRDGEDLATSTR